MTSATICLAAGVVAGAGSVSVGDEFGGGTVGGCEIVVGGRLDLLRDDALGCGSAVSGWAGCLD